MDLTHVPANWTDARSPAATPGVKRRPNLRALTSVRFFAALHVSLYHMVRPFSRWGALTGLMTVGYVAVAFFFLLSGFILTYSHADEYEAGRGSAPKFWIARFARIYPVYAVSLLYAAIASRSEFHNHLHVLAFGMDIFMVQSWVVRAVNFFNVPAWTLSVETFFYLCFPFLILRLRPSSARKALLATGFFWILALAVPLFCLARYPIPSLDEASTAVGSLFVFNVRRLPLLMLPQFAAGISLGWLFLRFPPTAGTGAVLATVGALATGAALLAGNHLPFLLLHNGLLLPLFAMLLVGLCQDNWLTRLLSNSVLVLLGEASFSLYLFHFLFNDTTRWLFGQDLTISSALLKLVFLIPASVALHLCVERPCRRLILDWWRRRHTNQLTMTQQGPVR